MSRTLPRFSRYILLVAAVGAAVYSFVLARAEWLFEQDTIHSVPAAVSLVPYNSTYLSRLASWLPALKKPLLERAVKLNPFDYQSLIQLGYLAEFQEHNAAQAECDYLRAESANQMFLPKWTLANFYFRQGRIEPFFHWANAALAITPYAPEPIFTEMWQMSSDPQRIARAIPDRARTLLAYAWFLSNEGHGTAIPEIVDRLVKTAGNRNPHAWGRDDLLATIMDRFVASGDVEPALSVWHSLSTAGWIPFRTPTSSEPITNGDFREPLYSHGFDWLPQSVDGIRFESSPPSGTLRIHFSGDEPEDCVLLKQYIPLEPGGTYDFSWSVDAELTEKPAGLSWHLRAIPDEAESQPPSPDLSQSTLWKTTVPQNTHMGLLSLEYKRPLGELRARGAITLQSVHARLH